MVTATKAAPAPTQVHHLYNGDVELHFYEKLGRKKHVYQLNGVEVPSVTKVLKVLDKPALMAWALNCMADALKRSWQPGVAYDEVQIPTLIEAAKGAKDEISGEARTVGSVAHDWIEQYIKASINEGDVLPATPLNPAVRAACDAFLSWEATHKVKWLASERRICSRYYGFAGTLDFEAEIDEELVLGDIKTSKGIWPEYWLQTAAYQIARIDEMGYIGGHEAPQYDVARIGDSDPHYAKRVILRLGKDPDVYGGLEFEVQESREFARDAHLFLAALTLQKGLAALNSFKGDQ